MDEIYLLFHLKMLSTHNTTHCVEWIRALISLYVYTFAVYGYIWLGTIFTKRINKMLTSSKCHANRKINSSCFSLCSPFIHFLPACFNEWFGWLAGVWMLKIHGPIFKECCIWINWYNVLKYISSLQKFPLIFISNTELSLEMACDTFEMDLCVTMLHLTTVIVYVLCHCFGCNDLNVVVCLCSNIMCVCV